MTALSIGKLSHTALNVTDMDKSAAFYRDVLGLEELYRRDLEGRGYSSGFLTPSGVMVELLQFLGESGEPQKVDASSDTVRLAFSVADIDEARTVLNASGIAVDHVLDFEGIRMLFISDPDGRVVEIAQFPDGIMAAAELHSI